jgi:hypothetical protein
MGQVPMYRRIVNDESLTRGLGDIEARMLVEWLTDWADLLEDTIPDEEDAQRQVTQLHKRAKAIGKFVVLWSDGESKAGAVQLALPPEDYTGDEVMAGILQWENKHLLAV